MSSDPVHTSAVQRIYQEVKTLIQTQLKPGDPLPSSRTLVEQHQASPNTIQKVLSLLAQEGLTVSQPGKGTFVALDRPADHRVQDHSWQLVLLGASPPNQEDFKQLYTPAPAGVLPLGSGYLDASLQPTGLLQQAMQRASRRPLVWERLPPEGLEPLRNWFARHLGVQAQHTLITSGAQTALSTVFRAVSKGSGQPVLVESPAHLGTLAILRAAGHTPIPVPGDAAGLRPDFLEQLVVQTGARILSCQPTFHNPTGQTWTLQRRQEVLQVCEQHGVVVVEDGATQDLHLDLPPPPALVQLNPGQVVHVASLTKPVAAGFRIAALCARGPLLQRLRSALVVDDLFVTGVMQEAALELLTHSGWEKHLRHTREQLKLRRDALLQGLSEHCKAARWTVPQGGFYVWLQLPEGTDEGLLATRALHSGLQVNPGGPWFPAETPGPHLRLSYAAAQPTQLQEGARLLGKVLQEVLDSRGGPPAWI